VLNIQTNGTTAISISASQAVSFTNTPTFTGGTANGVLYLNGSKVATSGSALTFDGTNLGIGGSPSFYQGSGLLISRSGYATIRLNDSSGGGTAAEIKQSDSAGLILESISNRPIQFNVNASEQMRLTLTGLGIGTSSPTQKLHVAGNILSLSAAGTDSYANVATSGVQNTYMGFNNSGSTNAAGALNNHSYFGSGNAYGIQFITNGSAAATINTSGNLGLGVTPSVWGSNRKAIQFGALGCVFSDNNVTSEIGANVYISTAPAYTYITSNFATRYAQINGQHQWHTAASGTAGNAISFTQAMTLDASGNLGVGLTDPGSFGKFTVSAAGIAMHSNSTSGAAGLNLYENGSGRFSLRTLNGSAGLAFFDTFNTVERARITSGGDLLVGTTSSGGTASNATRVTGGIFSTFNATPSIPNNTATTVATLPSGEGMYLVSASLLNSGTAAGYNELALVRVSQSNTAVSTIVGASSLDITVSGLNVQVTHGQGATQTIPVSIIRLL